MDEQFIENIETKSVIQCLVKFDHIVGFMTTDTHP